jgi:hypothetical protein
MQVRCEYRYLCPRCGISMTDLEIDAVMKA